MFDSTGRRVALWFREALGCAASAAIVLLCIAAGLAVVVGFVYAVSYIIGAGLGAGAR